jgi:hypothetical protein
MNIDMIFLKSKAQKYAARKRRTKERNINDKYSHMQKSLTESPPLLAHPG